MWEELQQKAKVTGADDNLAGQMTYTTVKESTSTAMGSDAEGSVFDVTIEGFTRAAETGSRIPYPGPEVRLSTQYEAVSEHTTMDNGR